jgi:16S rRNA (cytosine1402-N4)-methyltransferase
LDGILVDLGISSSQLDNPKRGFSFQLNGPLDMRMSQSDKVSAETWINKSTKEEIAKVLWEVGEERHSRKISDSICRERELSPINTTKRLSEVILASKPRRSKKHPATNVFRAIRMEVNSELQELQSLLVSAGKLLKEGGRLAVISFHSLEDRIVKRFVQGKSLEGQNFSFKKVGSKHFKPSPEEVLRNPRSRSAILRVVERVA